MAKALVEVIGDSASAVRALEQTSAAATATGDSFKGLAVSADEAAAAIAKANATRAESLLAQSSSLKQLSASSAAGSTEQMAANEAALKRQTQAYKLLGIQAASTRASVTQTAGTIGRGLSTYVTAPAAFIGYEAVKQAIDFNQQMLLLKTQAGDATDSIKKLSTQVLALASNGSPQGPTQLAEGLFHLVSLGLRGAQAMGTLREASLAAGMGMANLEDTSTALGAAVVSGIKGAQNYSQAMATLVGTAGAGNMRFQDLAASIGNVIPSAAASGITLHEMGAALAVMTDRGMSAEEAATRLRMSLSLIQRPSKQATTALADMGVNANDLGAMIRQPNGLLKVLEVLHTAINQVGTVRGNRDLLAAFGGARSGIGIQTLVQSLTSSVSSYQGKLQQIQQDQKQFADNQKAYLESPAYKLHAALSQVESDLVKLGQALTPAVTGVASVVSGLANAFTALPGPIKEVAGGFIGILAVLGPVGLAVSGLGRLFGGVARLGEAALGKLGMSMKTVGADATIAGTEGRAAFLSMLGPIAAAAAAIYGLDKAIKSLTGFDALHKAWGSAGFFADNTAKDTVRGKNPYPVGTSDYFEWQAGHMGIGRGQHHVGGQSGFVDPSNPAYRAGERARARTATDHAHQSGASPGFSNAHTSAPAVPGTTAAAAAAAAKKRQTEFNQAVHNDQLLAQARIDLANGETAAAQTLLLKDQERLRLMLSEAKTATERTAVLRQLGEVERLRHSKSSAFALSPELQMQIARADAQAALHPSSYGPDSDQIRLAKEAKAAALHAIHSHTLTLQGLTAAWQIVGQENSVLARAKGAINTYHAVYSKGIVDSVKGLSQIQQMQLRERIAQAEAHRGYAPNQIGSQQHTLHVRVHVESNDSHIVKVVDKHRRGSHQRAGARR